MVLSKRERYVGIIAGAMLGVLLLNYFVIEPLIERRNDLSGKITEARGEVESNEMLLARRAQLGKHWDGMVNGGLLKDASAAEIQVQHSLQDWAHESEMSLSSVKTERTEPITVSNSKNERGEREKDFYRVSIRATGTGTMAQIGHFLWRIQTASVPVSVADLQLNTRKEGSDDLSISLSVSTIALIPDSEKGSKPVAQSAFREMLQ